MFCRLQYCPVPVRCTITAGFCAFTPIWPCRQYTWFWNCLKIKSRNSNFSNLGRENYWKFGVRIPAPEGQKNFVLFSFHFQILLTKLDVFNFKLFYLDLLFRSQSLVHLVQFPLILSLYFFQKCKKYKCWFVPVLRKFCLDPIL